MPVQLGGALRVRIVAHASPRWRAAKAPQEADKDNFELSRKRADLVRAIVDDKLRELLGPHAHIEYDVDYVDDEIGRVKVGSEAHGSRDTLREAKGDRRANDQWYRRVDVFIDDIAFSETFAGTSRQPGTHKVTKQSTDWEVRVIGDVSFGVTRLVMVIRNPNTGREVEYHATGVQANLSGTLGAVRLSKDFVSFSTDRFVGFEDFNGAPVNFTNARFGGGFEYNAGVLTIFGFGEGAHLIRISGISLGIHLGTGPTSIVGTLSSSSASDEYDEPDPDYDWVPVGSKDTRPDLFPVFFETGKATLTGTDQIYLQGFVESATARFRGHTGP